MVKSVAKNMKKSKRENIVMKENQRMKKKRIENRRRQAA